MKDKERHSLSGIQRCWVPDHPSYLCLTSYGSCPSGSNKTGELPCTTKSHCGESEQVNIQCPL